MWVPGTEYTYEYNGRLLTGIPELSSTHFSGIGIKCKLSLIVTRAGRIILQIKDAQYARVNEVNLKRLWQLKIIHKPCSLNSGPQNRDW